MNNYKSLITGSLMVLMVIATPLVSFADKNREKDNNQYREKIMVEQELREKNKNGIVDSNPKGNSEYSNAIFHRFEDWFKNKKEIIRNRKAERFEDREKNKNRVVKDKDEVEKDTTDPVISKIVISTDTSNNVNISWKTNEKTTGEVFYGTSKGVDLENANTLRVSDKNLKTDHSINIPSLASDTIYHFVIKSSDASNNVTLSSEATFVTN